LRQSDTLTGVPGHGSVRVVGLLLLACVSLSMTSLARDNPPPLEPPKGSGAWVHQAAPVFDRRLHYIGELWTSFGNDGSWGTSHGDDACPIDETLLRINWCPSLEYPGGTRIDYLYNGGLWVGGIVGTDTLVSVAYDGWDGIGDEFNGFEPIREGLPDGYVSAGCAGGGSAKSLEQVYYTEYVDTVFTSTNFTQHTPMGLMVRQATHQSSDNFARDFVIYDLEIENIGTNIIKEIYTGVFNDCDVYYQFATGNTQDRFNDDISGFLPYWPNPIDPTYTDTLLVAWVGDNDGDPDGGQFPRASARGAFGWRFLRLPEGAGVSFNWWTSNASAILDWGPRLATDLRRLTHGGQGTPSRDLQKYWFMSNGEQDYGQLYSAVNFSSQGWKPPLTEAVACNLADGLDTRALLSAGPVNELRPGEKFAITFAFLGSDDIHRYPDNAFDCVDPTQFVNNLDFSDLAKNAWWAGFVFDNYGVDSDGDEDAGRHYPIIGPDTIFYTGDGCPDFTGPKPPTGPASNNLSLISRPNELEINWNGANSETVLDPLIRLIDFEGYRVYVAERNSPDDFPSSGDYAMVASWDIEDFRRFTLDPLLNRWEVTSHPFTVETWRDIFDDPVFDPIYHGTPDSAYTYSDFNDQGQVVERKGYFERQDFNQGNTIISNGVEKPNLIQRVGTRDTIVGLDTLTYGVYKLVLDNLLASKTYFVSVTAFDYGDPFNDLDPLETIPGTNRVYGIPIYSSDVVEDYWQVGGARKDSVRVSVYPNPYKSAIIGASGQLSTYFDEGFEGRFAQGSFDERLRRIHFINMPDSATVRIYTLDGDLVRELNHPDPFLSSYSSEISWDLISRNQQAVESGIYIYRVDSHLGAQVGKIVIIK